MKMSQLSPVAPGSNPLRALNPRAELRLALLAGAEACWLYALVFTVGTVAGLPREVSPLGIFIVYWVGLAAGRVLPRLPQAWRLLQVATVVIASIAILIAIRVGLYTDLHVTDLTWLPTYLFRIITLFERVSAEELSTLILVFAFVRGLSFAQRPLTLWVIGFQFRLGIVIFFALAVFGALGARVEFTFWIFLYFALYLLSISLARIEDAGQAGALGGRWALVMLTMLAIVLLVGFALTQLLTLDVVNAIFAFLSPLALIGEAILLLIAIPFIFLLDLIFQALAPLLRVLGDALSRLLPQQSQSNPVAIGIIDTVMRGLVDLTPYLRVLGVILVLGVLAWWIARALNKRMSRIEEEMVAREPVSGIDPRELERPRRPRAQRAGRGEIHAENVRRIYAALQSQAETLGLGRREAETPNEYLPRLSARFPDSTADLATITNAYVAVHYAQQNATDAQVRELRAVWNRLRDRMQEQKAAVAKP